MRTLSCATIFCFNLGVGSEGGQVRKNHLSVHLCALFGTYSVFQQKKRRNIFFLNPGLKPFTTCLKVFIMILKVSHPVHTRTLAFILKLPSRNDSAIILLCLL